jgi:hypothetical protein
MLIIDPPSRNILARMAARVDEQSCFRVEAETMDLEPRKSIKGRLAHGGTMAGGEVVLESSVAGLPGLPMCDAIGITADGRVVVGYAHMEQPWIASETARAHNMDREARRLFENAMQDHLVKLLAVLRKEAARHDLPPYPMEGRFLTESDGPNHVKTHYIVHTRDSAIRIDCDSRSDAQAKAMELNQRYHGGATPEAEPKSSRDARGRLVVEDNDEPLPPPGPARKRAK